MYYRCHAISADVCCLPEPTETSSTLNPGTTSSSGNDNTIHPTTDS